MAQGNILINEAKGFVGALHSAALQIAQGQVSDAAKARRGHLYALAATLRDAGELVAPHERLYAAVKSAADALPPQYSLEDHDSPFWQWTKLAALAEQDGDLPLAGFMVTQLLGHVSARPESALKREQLAICWARRGRLARQSGDLDDAEDSYGEAHKLIRGITSSDAWAQIQLGLSVVAALRGNHPLAEQRARHVASKRPHVHTMYRISAHHIIATSLKRRGEFIDALLSGWRAYDMLDREDARRFEIMIALSEIALEAGELDAAQAGFDNVIAGKGPERVIVPAAIGTFVIAKQRAAQSRNAVESQRAARDIRNALTQLEKVYAQSIQPHESVNLQLHIGDAHAQLNEFDDATTTLNDALRTSLQRGFHSFVFQAEALLDAVTKKSRETHASRPSVTHNHDSELPSHGVTHHRAVKRMFALATT